MLTVDTIAKIRRAFFVEKKPIKAICRELKRSRTAVRRAIRCEATEFRYERSVQPMPKLGAWREQLDKLLAANEAKPARERLTLVHFRDAARSWVRWRLRRGAPLRQELAESARGCFAQAYIPLTFAPGEAYQFDCSHETVVIKRRDDGGEGRAYAAVP
jgi:hypothetical protein